MPQVSLRAGSLVIEIVEDVVRDPVLRQIPAIARIDHGDGRAGAVGPAVPIFSRRCCIRVGTVPGVVAAFHATGAGVVLAVPDAEQVGVLALEPERARALHLLRGLRGLRAVRDRRHLGIDGECPDRTPRAESPSVRPANPEKVDIVGQRRCRRVVRRGHLDIDLR